MRGERYSKKDEEQGFQDRMKKKEEEEEEGDDEEEANFSRL